MRRAGAVALTLGALALSLPVTRAASAVAAPVTGAPRDATASEVAALRVLDARIDPPTGLVLDASPPVELGVASALGYLVVPSGTFVLALAAAPEEDGRPARALARQELELGVGTYTTVVVVDRPPEGAVPAPPGVGPAEIVTLVLADDLEALPPGGHTIVRIVHAAAGAGPAAVDLRPAELPPGAAVAPPPAAADLPTLDVEPLDAVVTRPFPAGAYELVVATAAGAAAPILVDLAPGVAYTLLITAVDPGVAEVVLHVDGAAPTPPHRVRGRP